MVVIAVVATAAATVIGVLYFQNKGLREDIKIMAANNAKLELSVKIQKQTILAAKANADEWKDSLRNLQRTYEELSRVEQKSTAEVRRLQEIFSRHNLSALALAKPGLVEKRINRGTARARRVLEHETTRGSTRAPEVGEPRGPPRAATPTPTVPGQD